MKPASEEIIIRKDSREASDAGLYLWRQNFSAFIPFFIIPFLLFAFLLRIILPDNFRYFSWLIVWLLKPLFDRLVLHVISVRFFDKDTKIKQLLHGLWKSIFRGLAGDILWRRFSPLRSAMMPVRVLEQNIKTRARYKERRKNLDKGGIGYCFFLTIWGIAVEAALLTGIFFFIISMSENFTGNSIFSLESYAIIEIFLFSAWCVNLVLVESIYVCMGFSLYINSRTETEGWDIEIMLRNIADKLKKSENSGGIVPRTKNPPLVILLLFFFITPTSSYAEDSAQHPFETLNSILENPEFGSYEETWGIRFKNNEQNSNEPDIENNRIDYLQRIFAYTLRIVLIGVIAGFIVFLIIYLYKIKKKEAGKYENHKEKIINRNNLTDPEFLLEKALNFHKHGEIRLAWGYCAAAAIQSWSLFTGHVFPANATEYDCINIIQKTENKKADVTQTDSLEKIIKKWIYIAYAGEFPEDGDFEEAVNFCITFGTQNG